MPEPPAVAHVSAWRRHQERRSAGPAGSCAAWRSSHDQRGPHISDCTARDRRGCSGQQAVDSVQSAHCAPPTAHCIAGSGLAFDGRYLMRTNGYAPIEDYAVIGDGRTAALVARDGSIDWLCLPNLDSSSVCANALDANRGGAFELCPDTAFTSTRRYVPNTNVLETTFETDRGRVRVVDALTIPNGGLAPMRELARSIEGLSGSVPMRWRFAPRFDYGRRQPRREWRESVPVASAGSEALAVPSWNAGTPSWHGDAVESYFEISAGAHALIALSSAFTEPLVLPGLRAVSSRLQDTIRFWERWSSERRHEG